MHLAAAYESHGTEHRQINYRHDSVRGLITEPAKTRGPAKWPQVSATLPASVLLPASGSTFIELRCAIPLLVLDGTSCLLHPAAT